MISNKRCYAKKITPGKIKIKIEADWQHYRFYFSDDGSKPEYVCSASTRFLCCELAGKCFTGSLVGIYAQSEAATSAAAKYYSFRVS